MTRRITDDPRNSLRRLIAKNPWRVFKLQRRIHPHGWMIVIEEKHTIVRWFASPAYTIISGTEITIFDVLRQRLRFVLDGLAAPGPPLTMRGDNHPLLTQGMPSLFPNFI